MTVAFNHSTLATTANLITEVETNLNRGTIGASSTPTTDQVTNWLVRAKESLLEVFRFSWARVFSYVDTAADTYLYALPADFAGGGTILRDISNDRRLSQIAPIVFDTLFPDVGGGSSGIPSIYCLKDRELWLSEKASGVYRLELEYLRTGEDSSAETWSYIPESHLFKLTDYATYRSLLMLRHWEAAAAYKSDWDYGIQQSKKVDSKKKWAAQGYKAHMWV